MTNRCLTYEEFLQTPASFVDDVVKILEIKEKWGLDLTRDEETIKNYIMRMRIIALGKHLNSTTHQSQ
jgi:hypothetical protein